METPDSGLISTRLIQIAQVATRHPNQALKTLAHHIDLPWLKEAFTRVRHDGAPGVDGVTMEQYRTNLEGNLADLLERFKSGRYRAPAVRRVYIPKGSGHGQRPLGIPTFEDKILQRAVLMVLEAVYEEDFLPCSYGFRPERGAHDALEDLWQALMRVNGGWVLDVDIEGFFNNLDQDILRELVAQRVRDGVMQRIIGKWLNAGVMEAGILHYPRSGTPQGGVISPLLSNIYLHEVIDVWFTKQVQPKLRGDGFLFRYADDFVIVCALQEDAERVMEVLPKRLGRFGLKIHPEKTRMVDFRRPGYKPGCRPEGGARAQSFDFLGFTLHWGQSRKKRWVVKRKTAKDRFNRTVKRIGQWCRTNRHQPLDEQQQALNRKLRGHDAYFGVTGNYESLEKLRWVVTNLWFKWLTRRNARRKLNWEHFNHVLNRLPLVPPRIVRSVYRVT